MHWFFPPLHTPPSSAGRVDGAAWRNPLSRHFSFPLTDKPWRARAFGPPAWLAARQLNKPSSCYNSLKHFQLPESNKSCRRALGCFSTSNPTPQRVLPRLSFGLSGDARTLRWRGRVFLDKAAVQLAREIGGYKLQGAQTGEMIWGFPLDISKLSAMSVHGHHAPPPPPRLHSLFHASVTVGFIIKAIK